MKTITYRGGCSYVPIWAHLIVTESFTGVRQQTAKVRQGDKLMVLAETTIDGEEYYYVNGPYYEQKGWIEPWYFQEED